MRTFLFYTFTIVLLMYACVQAQTKPNESELTDKKTQNDSIVAVEEEDFDDDLYWQQDSLKKVTAINEIIKYVTANQHQNYIEKKYEEEDPSYKGRILFDTNYRYGNIFSKKHKHLYIKAGSQGEVQYHVYLLQNNTFTQVAFFAEASIVLTGDTIIDRNGDGIKDLDIEWYAMAGCCLREAHEVHLCKPDGTFTTKYHFINPTFNTASKTIRGVDYGHPGRIPLYKYKWNGFDDVDTIEYIYPNIKDTVNITFIKAKSWINIYDIEDGSNNVPYTIINKLPAEYLNPKNLDENYLDWFLAY